MSGTEPTPQEEQPPSGRPPASSLARIRLWLWILAAAAAALGALAFHFLDPDKRPATGTGYASAFGGPFAMTDQNGATVTNQTLRGKPYAIFFGFTRCPDVCPSSLNRMAQLRKQLGADGMKVNIVFVSVDPGHDSRESIRDYLALFDTPIIGLSGNAQQLAGIVKVFGIYYAKVPVDGGDYTIDHSTSIILMDRDGRFVSTIDYHEEQAPALQKLRRLVAEG